MKRIRKIKVKVRVRGNSDSLKRKLNLKLAKVSLCKSDNCEKCFLLKVVHCTKVSLCVILTPT